MTTVPAFKVLKSPNIISAFQKIDRKDFIRPEYIDRVYEDIPLPIGYSQTISQPTTVGFMLELLEAGEGHKVLDVGSGSGWTTALLSEIVGPEGQVIGIELIPELVEFGTNNLSKYNINQNAKILLAGEELGYLQEAPYDRILVSASAQEIPTSLIKQLKVGGVMVVPVKNSVWKVVRNSADGSDVSMEEYPGFVFVPLK